MKYFACGRVLRPALCAGIALCAALVLGGEPVETLAGRVVDEDGRPVPGISVRICGVESQLPDGTWDRNRTPECLMPKCAVEPSGQFTAPLEKKNTRLNLCFEKEGFATTFLSGIVPQDEELVVVMKRGLQLSGTVKRQINGKLKPVQGAAVYARCLAGDSEQQHQAFRDPIGWVMKQGGNLPYQQHYSTGGFGEYTFRLNPPPKGMQWYLVCMDEAVLLDIKAGHTPEGPDFVVNVQVHR